MCLDQFVIENPPIFFKLIHNNLKLTLFPFNISIHVELCHWWIYFSFIIFIFAEYLSHIIINLHLYNS